MILATRIRKIREAYQLTQEDVADKCNISSSAYGQIERKAAASSYETLSKIAEAIGVSVPFLINIESQEFIEIKNKR